MFEFPRPTSPSHPHSVLGRKRQQAKRQDRLATSGDQKNTPSDPDQGHAGSDSTQVATSVEGVHSAARERSWTGPSGNAVIEPTVVTPASSWELSDLEPGSVASKEALGSNCQAEGIKETGGKEGKTDGMAVESIRSGGGVTDDQDDSVEEEGEITAPIKSTQPRTERSPSKKSLEVDADWETLAMYLDLLQVAQFPLFVDSSSVKLDVSQIRRILPMAKKFDCKKLLKVLDVRLRLLAAADPWAVLKLASDENDIDLGKCAISMLDPEVHIHGQPINQGSELWQHLDALQMSWQLSLIRCLAPKTFKIYNDPTYDEVAYMTIKRNLHAVSRDFNPRQYEPSVDPLILTPAV